MRLRYALVGPRREGGLATLNQQEDLKLAKEWEDIDFLSPSEEEKNIAKEWPDIDFPSPSEEEKNIITKERIHA